MRAHLRPLAGLVTAFALLASPGAAHPPGGNLDVGSMSAALALPVITGGFPGNAIENTNGDVIVPSQTAVTIATVTNGGTEAVELHAVVISGDPGDDWRASNFDCMLTGRETTSFVFVSGGAGLSIVYVECEFDNTFFTQAQNGILFVALRDPQTGNTISENSIFGDALVVDTSVGDAYAFPAIGFQAGAGQNDGDTVYEFDGLEYQQFPASVATNFLAPRAPDVKAELILFTLDGTAGSVPTPRVRLAMNIFNDDEQLINEQYEFDCFDIVALEDINPNLSYPALGSISGHLELVSIAAATPGPDPHDVVYGDANNIRTRGVHGWFVQQAVNVLVPFNEPTQLGYGPFPAGSIPGAWGRLLEASTTALIPFLSDNDPTFDEF